MFIRNIILIMQIKVIIKSFLLLQAEARSKVTYE